VKPERLQEKILPKAMSLDNIAGAPAIAEAVSEIIREQSPEKVMIVMPSHPGISGIVSRDILNLLAVDSVLVFGKRVTSFQLAYQLAVYAQIKRVSNPAFTTTIDVIDTQGEVHLQFNPNYTIQDIYFATRDADFARSLNSEFSISDKKRREARSLRDAFPLLAAEDTNQAELTHIQPCIATIHELTPQWEGEVTFAVYPNLPIDEAEISNNSHFQEIIYNLDRRKAKLIDLEPVIREMMLASQDMLKEILEESNQFLHTLSTTDGLKVLMGLNANTFFFFNLQYEIGVGPITKLLMRMLETSATPDSVAIEDCYKALIQSIIVMAIRKTLLKSKVLSLYEDFYVALLQQISLEELANQTDLVGVIIDFATGLIRSTPQSSYEQ
jgi:hypothetical protein